MARNTFEAWIPEEFGSNVIQRVNQSSAVEAHAQRVPMATETRSTPRSGGVGVSMVGKGTAYGEDTTVNDQIILSVQKFGQAVRVAEEDINDSLADILNAKMTDWATSYAKVLDNACLAVSVAKATSGCAFDSLYYTLTQADSTTGYSANSNITKSLTAAGTPLLYADLSAAAGLYESGDFFDESSSLVIAHPKFKALLRGVVDTQGRPIFQESLSGVPGGGSGGVVDTVFGYPVKWSLGARLSSAPTSAPSGHPLLIVCNPAYALLGVRSGPESVFIDGRNGLAALTDESILKMRSRRGFSVGAPGAFSVYEYQG
jgi:HK97 family phage major capsid protein